MDLYDAVTRNGLQLLYHDIYLYEDGRLFKHSDDMGPGSIHEIHPSKDILEVLYKRIRLLEYDRDIEQLQQKKEKLNK